MNVVFLPGTMCDERLWSRLLPELAPLVHPKFVSLSEVTDRESAKQTLLREIPSSSHIVAFSMGGYLALEHALANPHQVRSLVVVAASARGLNTQEKVRRQRMLEQLSTHPYAGISKPQLAAYLGPAGTGNPEIAATIVEMDRTLGGSVLQAQMRATMERPDLIPSLDSIDCPVLIVGSVNDRMVRVEDLQEMHTHLRDSRLQLLDGPGHMIPLESPDELAIQIRSFYDTLPSL
ncbi:alpha/beta hydrolase [Paraburkholderia sp. Ac-20342]|uniref:alpha/beta fold hydrolase n=1 Tax=Paraburkholderia sp. Ac-20342 TaxID=2703889 RepID=UPI00198042F3|nr:alpha/beta hydrolase [Paraburkholderia sp. Ac-20342]MBN3846132.1 alpha/beta hydrolase [Paraburkholderia sp. Ac-20342]